MKKTNKLFSAILIMLIAGIFSCQNPTTPDANFTVTVSGIVMNLKGAPQDSVQLILLNPFRNTDTTKTDGSFNYSFVSQEKNEVTTTLRFHHINNSFFDTTVAVVFSSTKKSIAIGEMRMKGVSGAIDSTVESRPSARAGIIKFISSSLSTISIRGAGNDVTNLVFEVRDSLGIPVDSKNSVSVSFELVTKPDTLVELNHLSAITNTQGQASVQVSSGRKAGQAQIQAKLSVKNAIDTNKFDIIRSEIVSVVIAGGLPVASHFSIGSDRVNIPGLVKFGMRNIITAIVGDTFGNPAQQGTLVSFTTTGGLIQSTAASSKDGFISVDLITGNPLPGNGFAVITAQVGTPGAAVTSALTNGSSFDEAIIIKGLRSQQKAKKGSEPNISPRVKYAEPSLSASPSASIFSKTISVLFSGAPRISSNDSTFIVPPLGSKQFQFTVDDLNGNPLSLGTAIRVTGVGIDTLGTELTGDLSYILPDTYDKSFTKFNIGIADKRTKNLSANIPFGITIEVTGDNGNIKKTFSGFLTSAASDSGKVGSITMESSTVDSVVVNGAGSPVSSTVQVKVLDVNKNPSANVLVSFAFTKTVGGGEYLSSSIATTNASGIASVKFNSGIRSGLVQVQATVKKNDISINSDIKSIYVKTGALASLNLVSSSNSSLSVKGGGGNESSILIFDAKDSLGNTIDGSNQANITLTLQGDTAGARINPSVVKTDPNTGRITTFVTAGIQSGIIQVLAKSGTISSSAIQISVSGGLPTQSQFTLSLPKKNYSILTDKATSASVTTGDVYGNPAKSGTLINFKTNGGLIEATSSTGGSGAASANLQIINPQPPAGIATIEARTFGAGGVIVRDTQTVVFSRDAIITEIAGPYANFDIEDGLSKTFQFRVADINGNPLAQGNTITVKSSGLGSANIVLSGDISVTTSDTKLQGVGTTQFSFTARDNVKDEGQGPKPLSFEISVAGPNTSGTLLHKMNGTLKGGNGTGNEGSVSSVEYKKSTRDTIFVANAGTPTTDTITFSVKNLNLQPVKGAAVQFEFAQSQNSSEFMSPSYMISDDSGEVKVAVHSGIKAGVLKIIAKVTAGNSVVNSSLVNVFVKTGPLASIALISVDKKEISVRGVGGEENATIIYEARDLLGNSLDFANQTAIYFSLKGVLGFDEIIKPDSARTDPFSGRVTVTVSSGTRSTVLQAIAQNLSGSIKSSPVPIVVHGGFTVDSLFIFKTVPQNISIYGGVQPIVMQLGDKYGNPPKSGTAVYFETNAGIVSAASFTDATGLVSSQFTPVTNAIYQGNKTITASTVGSSTDGLIKKTYSILMSGKPTVTVTNVPTDTVTLFDGASTAINFEIADNLGNPISSGHSYIVTTEGAVGTQITTSGDVNGLLPDTQDKINGIKYGFTVKDLLTNGGTGGNFKIKISLNGETGVTTKIINGKLLAPANIVVSATARAAASIGLIGIPTNLRIAGGGGIENTILTFEVRDSVGAPITLDNRATVRFTSNFYPNTFVPGGTAPSILPKIDSTDETGKVRVSVLSGTQAGVVQIEALINLTNPVRTIKSQPVKIQVYAGFADQKHFTISASAQNFPGLEKAFYTREITVQAADTFSNPILDGTAIYFNSAHGTMTTGSASSTVGFVTNTLYSANPLPQNADTLKPDAQILGYGYGTSKGFSRVYARTLGRDGRWVIDSVLFLWTGSPLFTNTGASTFTIANGGSGGPFTFKIVDRFGHPMSAGTTVKVTASTGKVSGDISRTIPDTFVGGAGITTFSVSLTDDAPTDTNPTEPSTIVVDVSHPVYGAFQFTLATGTID